jgi:multimeric flavodoxin WrbA
MKILGISAGTRDGNNDSMCKEALKGAKEAGAEIEFIRLLDLDIKHCTGCIVCVKTLMSGQGGLCSLKDDFDWLRDRILDADGVIFSVPIFEKGALGVFRTVLDRFGPRMDRANNVIGTKIARANGGKEPDQRILENKAISYMALGGSEWTTRVQCDLELLSLVTMWKTINNEVFDWSTNILLDDKRIEKINEIGKNLAKAAADIENSKYLGDSGICPHCHSRNFYLNNNSNEAICCLCGIVGEIKSENGKISFKFPEEQILHAHNTMEGKYIHVDDIKNTVDILTDMKKSDIYKDRIKKYKEFIQPVSPKN